jgi:TPP-dependent pyruvate/acetoin dehydrogenase alpha subunit
MAEMFAKKTGCCKGMGGSMHIADFSKGMLGANGIVGAGIPIAAGAGLSCKLRGQGQVAVSFFGDGAVNEGAFHEGVNLAAAWRLPVVFVCENNLYGFSTHFERTVAIKNVAERAAGYGIPGVIVDGMDLIAVQEAAAGAIQRARGGYGPTLLECKTYRFTGHARFERGDYRTKEEVDLWKKKDPLILFEAWLLQNGATAPEIGQVRDEVKAQIEAAVAYAEQSPDPEPLDYQQYIFA